MRAAVLGLVLGLADAQCTCLGGRAVIVNRQGFHQCGGGVRPTGAGCELPPERPAGGTGGGVPANNTRTHTLCEVQGYLLQFFYLASYVWTGCFAWHLYQLIDARNRTPRKLEPLYHAYSWGIPFLVSEGLKKKKKKKAF